MNENLNWRPEVGEKAWMVSSDGHVVEVKINKIHDQKALVSSYLHHIHRGAQVSCRLSSLYRSAEEAMANVKIKVYNLEGEQVNPQCKYTFELKPLVWNTIDMDEEMIAFDGDWVFYAWRDGGWAVFFQGIELKNEDSPLEYGTNFDTAKSSIQDWRLKHLESLI